MVELRDRALLPKVLVAFACIYFLWGSTFLAIRYAIAHLPPVLMCGLRLSSAGIMLMLIAFARGQKWPTGREWWNALAVGLLLPAFGNTSVTVGETHVPSGIVALLLGTIPLWTAVLAAIGPTAVRPGPQAVAGLLMGFAGIALLIGPGLADARRAEFSPLWALIPIAGSATWAWGSLYSRRVKMPRSPMVSTAIGLTGGGLVLLLLSGAAGEWAHFSPASVPASSWLALAYLSVFGSVVSFTAYLYLLEHVRPAVVATYAFVNPIVAMVLGFFIGHEVLSPRTLTAAALVVVAVALITTERAGSPSAGGRGATNHTRVRTRWTRVRPSG